MKPLLECGSFYTIQFDSQRDRLRLYWLKHLRRRLVTDRVLPEIRSEFHLSCSTYLNQRHLNPFLEFHFQKPEITQVSVTRSINRNKETFISQLK